MEKASTYHTIISSRTLPGPFQDPPRLPPELMVIRLSSFLDSSGPGDGCFTVILELLQRKRLQTDRQADRRTDSNETQSG